jgi:hypothetical protein
MLDDSKVFAFCGPGGAPASSGVSRPSWSPRPACRTPTPSASGAPRGADGAGDRGSTGRGGRRRCGHRHGGEHPAHAGCGPRAPQGGVLPRRDEGWVCVYVRGSSVRVRGDGAPGLGRGPIGRGRGAGSSVFGCVRGPGGAGGGGLGGWWVVCGRAGRCRVRRLPAVFLSRSGLTSLPSGVLACLSGLVWLCDTRPVRDCGPTAPR